MNKTAHYIINYCIDHKIGTLVSGYNPDWKRNINIGKVNNLCVPSCSNYQRNPSSVKVRKTAHDNQNFVQIPHGQLRLKLQALCERYAIDYLEQEESYTSKASFLDKDEIPTWTGESKDYVFSGQRIHRGLYQSRDGKKINADVNGAANILRKSKQKFKSQSFNIDDVERLQLFEQLCIGALASPVAVVESRRDSTTANLRIRLV